MMIWGLDEAGLGPRLGPFCAAATGFETSASACTGKLFDILSSVVSRNRPQPRRIAVGDSKRLYAPSKGMGVLEEGVSAFFHAAGLEMPLPFTELIAALCPAGDAEALTDTPWFADADSFILPLMSPPPELCERLMGVLQNRGIHVMLPRLRFITARSFNRELDNSDNKSEAIRRIVSPLLSGILQDNPGVNLGITVDRQGGRRYYSSWITDILPGVSFTIQEETPRQSVYHVGTASLAFLVKADVHRLEVALASMTAKYLREIAMKLFNRYWAKRAQGIRPTAGYPQDAARFLADLKNRKVLPNSDEVLIRRL